MKMTVPLIATALGMLEPPLQLSTIFGDGTISENADAAITNFDEAVATALSPPSSSITTMPLLSILPHRTSSFDTSFVIGATPLNYDFLNIKNEILLWTVRILSACFTYFGFVLYNDRPRGVLNIPLQSVAGTTGGGIRVGKSNVAGLGLFVTGTMLPKGTVLGTYPGVVIPLQQHSYSQKIQRFPKITEYVWRFTDNRYVIDPTNHETGILEDFVIGGNPSQLFSVPLFQLLSLIRKQQQQQTFSTALCRINEPPIGYDVNVNTEEDLAARTVTFFLERDVYNGEELFIDYGLTYDRSMYQKQ